MDKQKPRMVNLCRVEQRIVDDEKWIKFAINILPIWENDYTSNFENIIAFEVRRAFLSIHESQNLWQDIYVQYLTILITTLEKCSLTDSHKRIKEKFRKLLQNRKDNNVRLERLEWNFSLSASTICSNDWFWSLMSIQHKIDDSRSIKVTIILGKWRKVALW